jgi:M6 family metalloprotease-like protein
MYPWYWSAQGNHPQAWIDAIQASNPDVNYAQYDANGDGRIAPQEATVVVLRPNRVNWGVVGLVRPIGQSVNVDGVQVDTVIDAVYSAVNPNTAIGNQRGAPLHTCEVGNMAHELMHMFFGGSDMYDDDDGGGIDRFFESDWASLMDRHYFHPHVDPFHKLKLGFLVPNLIAVNSFTPGVVNLQNVETTGEALIIYDPTRGDSEYFIVENRFKGTSYDVVNQLNSGPFVWHVVENFPTARARSSTGVTETNVTDAAFAANVQMGNINDWGRFSVRFLGSVANTSLGLRFTGNTNPSIRISNNGGNAATIGITLANP